MPQKFESVDTLAKLLLAILMVICYFAKMIQGPLAEVALALALLILVTFVTKIIVTRFLID